MHLVMAADHVESTRHHVFIPQDSCDQPCDVTLVVEEGKEFKAHRHILAKASSFFEKMLNSDMKEATEPVLGDILESI